MLNNQQFREVIVRPALNLLCLYSENAEELLVATMAHESLGGTYVAQVGGPAYGIFQMEGATYDSIWNHQLSNDVGLSRLVLNGCQYLQIPLPSHMIWNSYLATMMARIYYRRVREALPDKNDIEAIAKYWKCYWNTSSGKGNVDDFIANYHRFLGVKSSKKASIAV